MRAQSSKAFTLIELITVIAIIAILAGIVVSLVPRLGLSGNGYLITVDTIQGSQVYEAETYFQNYDTGAVTILTKDGRKIITNGQFSIEAL